VSSSRRKRLRFLGAILGRWMANESAGEDQKPNQMDDLQPGLVRPIAITCAAIASAFRLTDVPTDAERFQFIAKFRLHVSFHSDHVTLMWQEKVQHWEASPPYSPVASGPTLEDATDAAIARYNRKNGIATPGAPERAGVQWLRVPGCVS
jgi:hypothetical protein